MTRKIWACVILCVVLAACIMVTSCAARPDSPPLPGSGTGTGSPGEQINTLAAWATGVASLILLIGCPILAWIGRTKLAGTIAGICITIIIAAPIVGWIGDWLPWIAGSVAVLGLSIAGLAAWSRRRYFETIVGIDINGDGTIGA